MSDTVVESLQVPDESQKRTWFVVGERSWSTALSLPLLFCFLVAILTRVWIIVHTHGVLDGDEATVGIQAEHILRGEWPIYYYSQAYLGSLQAYVIALIFHFTGPTVWAMRIEPIFTSLLIVYLTWRFAAALADAAHLAPRARQIFMLSAALVAAFAPLYDVIEEMRATGGYIEAFAVMLWLLLCSFRLTQRWGEQVTRRELLWRWCGLGLLIGFGLCIDPLIIYAYLTIALWFFGFFALALYRAPALAERFKRVREAFYCLVALPALVVGFIPGIIWGLQNNWANLAYIFQNGGSATLTDRLHTILQVQKVYLACLAPRAMGGALSTQPDVTPADPHILTFGLVVVGTALLLCLMGIGLAALTQRTSLLAMSRLSLMPVLFFLSASLIFSLASISVGAIYSGCGPVDYVGRYVVALVIVLPFLVATALVLPLLILQELRQDAHAHAQRWSRPLKGIQVTLLAVLVAYFCAQGIAYIQADPNYTFHPTGCVAENPTSVDSLLAYLVTNHIHYAWSSSWIGNRITFLTNGAIVATDWPGRVVANGVLVLHSPRPAIILLASHNGPEPKLLQLLDAQHVTYHSQAFYAEPGVDTLIVTSLSRTISPLDPIFAPVLNKTLIGCLL